MDFDTTSIKVLKIFDNRTVLPACVDFYNLSLDVIGN